MELGEKSFCTCNVAITDDERKKLEVFCGEVNIPMDKLFAAFAKKVIHTWKLPFKIDGKKIRGDIPNRRTRKIMRECDEMLKHPETLHPVTLEEFFEELDAQVAKR